jgi:hypothetical protein
VMVVRKPVVAKRVNVRPLNRKALASYTEFWLAIQAVGEAVDNAEKFALKADDGKRVSWSAPSAEELRDSGKKAGRAVAVIARSAKKWKTELVTREWKR